MRKIFITILTFALLVPPFVIHADVPSAVAYLNQQTPDEWITMAEVAAGQAPANTNYLKTFTGSKATDYAKRILAIVAVGQDPTTYAGVDLVQGLKGMAQSGQLGDATLLNDDAWGILALRAAGVDATDAALQASKTFLLAHQGSDGGWGYAVAGTSDTNDTAAVLMALAQMQMNASDTAIASALTYLHANQNSDGGFPYASAALSDSGSTAWVWSGLLSWGQTPAAWTKNAFTPVSFLQTLQLPDGSYKWQAGDTAGSPTMTAFSVVALSNAYYPVKPQPGNPSQGASVFFRIEGANAQVCRGQITAANALEVVKLAASVCNFTYHVQTLSFGPYLDQINSDTAAGEAGWMYMVNWQQPSVGADQYQLKTNDQVLWYFGKFTAQPLRLTASANSVSPGASVTLTAEALASSAWQPQSGVSIKGFVGPLTTDAQGQVVFTAPSATNLSLFAEADNFIRSDKVGIVVGTTNSQTVALDVTVNQSAPPPPPPPAASFTVSSSHLSWGTMQPGQAVEQQVTLTNTSAAPLSFGALVTGDDVFTSYLTLDRQLWSVWQTKLASAKAAPVTLSLPVPASYAGAGHKTASLIFWAAPGS